MDWVGISSSFNSVMMSARRRLRLKLEESNQLMVASESQMQVILTGFSGMAFPKEEIHLPNTTEPHSQTSGQ